ncbi:ATP-binding cassette domain-containing protein [Corynebacterium marquesiae]|uniref:ATP-binding cassette domain-containing protein n=1 Tax=Corynebacterium marquesiae TaxID=2913503 RepID=UPI0022BA1308|nr:ATP-binding cassette domain-containing protein [Corynebacterium marquesiae]MCZ9299634.1 ABC transporter [Corynebacterium marquesiae]
MDLARIKPTPGAIYQVLVEPDTAVEDVAVQLAERLSTEAIIGTDASAQISFLRETCIEEVVLGLENAGVPAAEMQRRGERMLRAVGLSDYCEHDPTQLSGGQTRRLAAACVAIREPEVMIVCEPAAGLDANSRTQVVRLLQAMPETCVISVSSSSWPELGGDIIGTDPLVAAVDLPRVSASLRTGSIGPVTARRGAAKKKWWHFSQPRGTSFSVGPVEIPIAKSAVTWLRGDNGSGKTTLLRAAAGLDGAGAVPNPPALALQSPFDQAIFPTVDELVPNDTLRNQLGLNPADHPLDLPSSRLRLAQIAHVIGQQRSVVLLDEPDTLLSAADRWLMHQMIHHALQSGSALVVTCHDPKFVAEIETYAQVTEKTLPAPKL